MLLTFPWCFDEDHWRPTFSVKTLLLQAPFTFLLANLVAGIFKRKFGNLYRVGVPKLLVREGWFEREGYFYVRGRVAAINIFFIKCIHANPLAAEYPLYRQQNVALPCVVRANKRRDLWQRDIEVFD